MRGLSRALIRTGVYLSMVAGGLGAMDARGSSVQIGGNFTATFEGTTTGTAPAGIAAGDAMTGTFSYMTGMVGKVTGSTEVYSITNTNPSQGEALSFDILPPASSNDSIYTDLYYTGLFQITMSKSGGTTTMSLYSTTYGAANLTLVLTSTTYTGGLALPTNTTTLGQFLVNPSLSYDPPSFTFEDNPVTISPNSLFGGSSVPEPSSMALALLALGTGATGFLFRARKARAKKPVG